MLNLLLISPQSTQAQGGMTVWTDAFCKHCPENEVECDLVNIATIGSRAVKGNSKRNFFDEFVRTKRIFKNLKEKLSSKKYSAAHVNTSCGSFGLIRDYMIVKRIRKKQPHCKCIVHFHCDVKSETKPKYKRYFLSKLLKITDRALALNDENKKFLARNYSVSAIEVPNFIDEKLVRKDEKQISKNIEKALFVGFVQPRKGAREIYDLARKFPQITFDLVGEVRSDVKEWEKTDNVILHGPKGREDIIKALDDADVFIFPTYSEGFSIALLESMSRGLPSIITDVGANAEMLGENGGVVVSVGDVPAMEKALESLQDPVKRREMSAWNIQKVRSEYTAQGVMKKIAKLYL